MEKISIIVPVYGVEKYIIKCIDSIVNQTYKDIEVLIINDGTQDNSIKLIEENYHDKRIKIYNRQNGGQAAARNFAIKKATGDYLLFVDGDDFIDKGMVMAMYQEMQRKKVNLVICDYYKYYSDDDKLHVTNIPFYDEKNDKCSVICMPGPVCKLFRRDIFSKYNIEFLEKKCFEDNAIMPFACAVSGKFAYLKKPFYYYVQREGSSLNKQKYDKKWEDIFDSLAYLYNYFMKYDMYDKYHAELEYIYIEYLLHAANLRFIDYKDGEGNIKKVASIMKNKFPKWHENKYYKKSSIKYKVMCNLFYHNKIQIIKMLRSK